MASSLTQGSLIDIRGRSVNTLCAFRRLPLRKIKIGFFEHDIGANEVIPGSIPSDIPLLEGTHG